MGSMILLTWLMRGVWSRLGHSVCLCHWGPLFSPRHRTQKQGLLVHYLVRKFAKKPNWASLCCNTRDQPGLQSLPSKKPRRSVARIFFISLFDSLTCVYRMQFTTTINLLSSARRVIRPRCAAPGTHCQRSPHLDKDKKTGWDASVKGLERIQESWGWELCLPSLRRKLKSRNISLVVCCLA